MGKGIFTLLAFLLLLSFSVNAQVMLDNPVWKNDVGAVSYLGTGNTERGGDFNQATDHVLIVSRKSGLDVIVLDAATGDSVGELDVTGISGGIFSLNEISVTSDGQIYGANLVLDATTSNVKIYRWENESSTPVNVYDGLVAVGRFGDGTGVVGSGSDVDFLLTGTGNNLFAKFHWDGSTFTGPTVVTMPDARASGGFAHVMGEDSVWTNRAGFSASKVNLMDGGVGTAISTGILLSGHNDIDYWEHMGYKLIATGVNGSTDQSFRVVDVTVSGNPMVVAQTEVLGPNANTNAAGFVAFDPARGNLIVMGCNNAVAAYSLDALFAAPPFPPMDVMAMAYGPDALLSWTLERPDIQIAYHDYVPTSGYYQAATSAYGVLFDVSALGAVTLDQLDFHHYGYAFQAGPYDYKLYVYDWTNQTVLAEIDNLVAKDAFSVGEWELAVDLGSLPANTTQVGVFLQGKTVDSFGDVWPTLSTGGSAPVAGGQVVISDLANPFTSATDPGNTGLGNFLMDLWLSTPSGEKILATKGIEDGDLLPSLAVNSEQPLQKTARGIIPNLAIQPKPMNNSGLLEAITSFNIYRGPDAGSLVMYDEVTSTPTTPYIYYMDTAALQDSMYTYGVSAV
jgi:hypothetical protein